LIIFLCLCSGLIFSERCRCNDLLHDSHHDLVGGEVRILKVERKKWKRRRERIGRGGERGLEEEEREDWKEREREGKRREGSGGKRRVREERGD
jgi:hypothetical protein